MEYKDTLLMPKTEFEMRGKLPNKEPGIHGRWDDIQLYEKMLEKREGCEPFILHDGPPYANGDIHTGHSLNKILKDVINRSKFMMGYKIPFIPGWDTHGLPIENAIQKLGHNRKEMSIVDFRKLCNEYALKQVANQKAGFKSLGCIGDYKNPYITLQKEFEYHQIEVFAKMAIDGLIYKGLKPVYWSPSSESALAEAEIEYHDIKSPTIFVKFNVLDGKGLLNSDDSFVIWTTTPWTIPANLAISLNPNMEYAVVKTSKGNLIVLKSMVEDLMNKFELEDYSIIKTFIGKEAEYITTKHPLYERESLIIVGDHVTDEAGTGCVHTAPGFGVDDFNVCKKYDIEPYCNVDDKGFLTSESGEDLAGLFVDDANKVVANKLDELGALLKFEWLSHSYPHDWRTKKPIIFRATTQWFASIDKIRTQLLDEITKVDWIPAWGETRLYNMIRDRGDWCISRQRAWGVPIPIIYAEDETPIMDEVVFKHISKLVKEYGSNVWFEKDVKDLLPEGYTHPGSPNNIFTKETDTMDVWFDSGSSHTGVLVERGLGYQADLYFEGSDQYRGWFNSSLIIGTAVYGKAPYKQVLSHGFIMDGKGEKMSKSKGNTVNPKNIIKQYGADILRLWASSIDYQADGRISDEIIKQNAENYRKVRNTFRFLMANVNETDFTKNDLVDYDKLELIDKYMIVLLKEVNDKVIKAYNEYKFADVCNSLTNLMTNEFSAYYLDFTKDILYIEGKDSLRRRQVQSVIYTAIDVLSRLWAPILVHTCEEINDYFKKFDESIHLQQFATLDINVDSKELKEEMNELFKVRDDVLKALEEARSDKTIGKSLEADVSINLNERQQDLVNKYLNESLAQWLIVSKAQISNEELKAYEVCQVKVEKCNGVVCPRCWTISESNHVDGLCDRCARILGEK